MIPLADLLTRGSEDAEAQLAAMCLELGVLLLPDHEGALLQGAFVERRPIPRAQYLELARSWEQFDRAFAPATASARDLALGQLERFVKWAGVARNDAPDILVSLGEDAWDEWLDAIGLTRQHGERAAEALIECLLRDPRPHGRSREPGR